MKKIAIVTGASRGLGRGTALILATEGNYSVMQLQEMLMLFIN